jgi:hypothetical protein
MRARQVKRILKHNASQESSSLHLLRAFGFGTAFELNPFRLIEDPHNDSYSDLIAGFPWHPHPGIKSIASAIAETLESDENTTMARSTPATWIKQRRHFSD